MNVCMCMCIYIQQSWFVYVLQLYPEFLLFSFKMYIYKQEIAASSKQQAAKAIFCMCKYYNTPHPLLIFIV